MRRFMLGHLALLALGGCVGSGQSVKSEEVPDNIANARLMSYSYSLQGSDRWPDHSERVERCENDPSRCVVSLFDPSSKTCLEFDEEGEPIADSLEVSSCVLDSIKQMLIEAQAWRLEPNYAPEEEESDGWSWGYSAVFGPSDTTKARRHGVVLSSSGHNADAGTDLFVKVCKYLQSLFAREEDLASE